MKTDNKIRVEVQPSEADVTLEVGMAVTSYHYYIAQPNTIIAIDYYKSGANKGQVKNIVLAKDEYMGEDNWNTRLDVTTTYRVKLIAECTEPSNRHYRCHCQGNRYLFCEIDQYGQMRRGSYGRAAWQTLGLGYREDYADYTSEFYLSN